jgi:hypothetical protein
MKIGYKPTNAYHKLAIASIILASGLCGQAQASGPVAKPPYTVSVFAAPPSGLTNPDSITTANGNIYVVYANATNPDGTGGFSTIVEYSATGAMLRTFNVVGKADGLKYNPFDGNLWALRNEDSNPALTLIDPKTGVQRDFTYAQPPAHMGGYDDVVFTAGATFISASNPTVDTSGQNIFPSIVQAQIVGNQIFVTPVLKGNAPLVDIPTGQNVVSPQSDPDSLKVDSSGDLVLDSQADGDLIFINAPGSPNQAARRLHLSNGTSTQITVDDTVFPNTPSGTIYVVDTKANTVYAVKSDAFQPGGAYSASDSDKILGKVDLSTGLITPLVTGMKSPHGALFVPAFSEVSYSGDFNGDGKQDILWRNTQTGEVDIWFMNGASVISKANVGVLGLEWKIVGIADFNGDGKSDILWQNTVDGSFGIWIMNGSSYLGHGFGSQGLQWSITGVADLDHTGFADILWRNAVTGQLVAWKSSSGLNFTYFNVGTAGLDWNLVGAADLFGSGQSALIWRNQNSGEVVAWQLSGQVVSAQSSLGVVPLNWTIAGFGDFNADGRTDILWHNGSDGSVVAWLMNGFAVSATWINQTPISPQVWQITATPNVVGSNFNSILWSNVQTGEQVIWTPAGTGYSQSSIGFGPPPWTVLR